MSMPIRLGLIYGSSREGRFCDVVADWAASEIERSGGFALSRIDPLALDLPAHHPRGEHAGVVALRRRLDTADAFVIVTPEYNRGYPAVLKHMIDLAGPEWHAKPIAFVSYGGISGGLRAVEQLRLVFAELHAVTIRDCVSFANAWERFDADGGLPAFDGAPKAMAQLLDRLGWWALALREARRALPYGKIAA